MTFGKFGPPYSTLFEGITEEELMQFQRRVKEQNLNLKLEDIKTDQYDISDSNFMNYKLKDKYPAYDNSAEWETGWGAERSDFIPMNWSET